MSLRDRPPAAHPAGPRRRGRGVPVTPGFAPDLRAQAATPGPRADAVEPRARRRRPPRCSTRSAPPPTRAPSCAPSNRELHFRKDETTGRVIVQVRDLDGNVLEHDPAVEALDVMAGAEL